MKIHTLVAILSMAASLATVSVTALAGQTYAQRAASQVRTDNPVCQNIHRQLLSFDQSPAGRSNNPAFVRSYDRMVSRTYGMAERSRCTKN
ncbi:MAG: hypothetical protein KKD65_12785 [Gammaproteobacteria bacterium]|nr:hypothetical protein [Gammaproteobacteria bacterium]